MALIVQKFGGTSVGSPERIHNVARRVARTVDAGNQVVVVVSAMGGETDRLLGLARAVAPSPRGRELDVLLASGEQVSVALLSLALRTLGKPARSFLAHQIEIRTDDRHGRARIRSIAAPRVLDCVERGEVPVVAGFQGVDDDGNITTLGRGGSDTTAVAVAAAVGADVCEIYTDVDGIYTADPGVVPDARRIEAITYEEMLELASQGAKVLQPRSVLFAMKYGVPVHVRSSFSPEEGSWVLGEVNRMEGVLVTGVTTDRNEAKVSLLGVRDVPGIAARIFDPLAAEHIPVDMIIQNASEEGHTDVTFTVPQTDVERAAEIVRKIADDVGARGVKTDTRIAKVSVIGIGVRSNSEVAAKVFTTLADAGINIEMISTSEIRISCVIDARYAELAVRLLHEAFDLGAAPAESAPSA